MKMNWQSLLIYILPLRDKSKQKFNRNDSQAKIFKISLSYMDMVGKQKRQGN